MMLGGLVIGSWSLETHFQCLNSSRSSIDAALVEFGAQKGFSGSP